MIIETIYVDFVIKSRFLVYQFVTYKVDYLLVVLLAIKSATCNGVGSIWCV